MKNCYFNKQNTHGTSYPCDEFDKNICVQTGEIVFSVNNPTSSDHYSCVRSSLNNISLGATTVIHGIAIHDVYPDKDCPKFKQDVEIYVAGLVPILNTGKDPIRKGDLVWAVLPDPKKAQYPNNYVSQHRRDRYVYSTESKAGLGVNQGKLLGVAQSNAVSGKIFYIYLNPNYELNIKMAYLKVELLF